MFWRYTDNQRLELARRVYPSADIVSVCALTTGLGYYAKTASGGLLRISEYQTGITSATADQLRPAPIFLGLNWRGHQA